MPESKEKRDPIPAEFRSLEEAAGFWDSHDVTDYWDLTREANVEVDLKRRVFLAALESDLAKRLADWASKQGVSTETLINMWLTEKLNAVSK